jgi:deoxyribodipyrimidine photo-lyase
VSSNYGNWLYQAGLGVDPRQSRIFDVTWQGTKYDESTLYLRKWLPQFQKLPKDLRYNVMHVTPIDELKYDFVLGKDYPYPIVDKPFIPIVKKKSK